MEDAPVQPAGDAAPRQRRSLVFGALLIVGGILLLVNQLTVFHAGALWPFFLIGVGLVRLIDACCNRQRRIGVAIAGLGTWFALNEFTRLSYHDSWPLLLLLWGTLLVWNGVSPDRWCPTCHEGRHAH